MGGAADHNLPALHQIDARLPGFYVNIAAAAQKRLHLAPHHFHGHRPIDRDGFAFDHPDRICGRIVGAHRGSRKGSGEHGGANQKAGDAAQCSVIGRAGQLIRSPSGRGNGGHSIYYRKMENRDIQGQESEAAVGAHYDTRLPKLPWSRRIQIPIIAALVYSVIRVLGPTLRFEKDGRGIVDEFLAKKEPCIWAFWHRVIVPISWYARDRE